MLFAIEKASWNLYRRLHSLIISFAWCIRHGFFVFYLNRWTDFLFENEVILPYLQLGIKRLLILVRKKKFISSLAGVTFFYLDETLRCLFLFHFFHREVFSLILAWSELQISAPLHHHSCFVRKIWICSARPDHRCARGGKLREILNFPALVFSQSSSSLIKYKWTWYKFLFLCVFSYFPLPLFDHPWSYMDIDDRLTCVKRFWWNRHEISFENSSYFRFQAISQGKPHMAP